MTNDSAGLGDCFLVSSRIVVGSHATGHVFIDQPTTTWELVHAVILGNGGIVEGKYYWHAWAEATVQMPHVRDNGSVDFHAIALVVDKSNNQDVVLSQAYYYQQATTRHLFRYTADEARTLMQQTGTFGPWVENYNSLSDV